MKYNNDITGSFITNKLLKNDSVKKKIYVSSTTKQLSVNDRKKGKRHSEFKKISSV